MDLKDVPKKLNEDNHRQLYLNLVEIHNSKNIHDSKEYVLLYHEKVLEVFQNAVKLFSSGEQAFDEYNIRWMLARLLEYSQRKYVWVTLSSEKSKILDGFKEPEKFVVYLWEYLEENDKSKRLINWLEINYQLNSKAVGYCLSRYAIGEAIRVSHIKTQNWFLAGVNTLFLMPLFAGVAVGWLFLLQAGDAIKYFTNLLYSYTTVSVLAPTIIVPLLMSWSYIYYYGEKNGVINLHKRSLQLILWALLFSLLIGAIMIYYGFEWFKLQNDWIKEIVKDINIRDQLLKEFATEFLLIWASMAVFIGIFAQLIWSGRGPTEIND